MILLLLISMTCLIWGLYELVANQVQQITEISFIKKEQIRSRTIAELKQYDFQLVVSDLWASAKTISDLVSNPNPEDGLRDDTYLTENLNKVVNAHNFGVGLD